MCYSAQVVQTARKLHRQLGARLDYDEAGKLFLRRLDDPAISVSRGFEANFDDPSTDQERRIKDAIDAHRSPLASKFEKELFSQKTRLAGAGRALQRKETKKAREDVRIASNKIAALASKLSHLRRTKVEPEDNRIFLLHYAGVGHQKGRPRSPHGDAILLPAGKPKFYDPSSINGIAALTVFVQLSRVSKA